MKKQKPLDEIKAEILGHQETNERTVLPVNEKPRNIEMLESPSRRGFLKSVGLTALLLGLGAQVYAMLRALVPNVLYEPPQKFKVGTAEKFAEGGTFIEEKRLFIFRKQNTFHTVSAVCTHLGCTVKMMKLNQPKQVTSGGKEIIEDVEFHCPCHGSKYYGDGTNYAGPAPRHLDSFKLELSPDDGQLIVDKAEKVEQGFRLTV